MHFKYLADHKQAIPIVAEWYFNEWGHKMEEHSSEQFSHQLHKYLNRDKIPFILLAIEKETIIGVAQLKFREMDIYPDKQHWIGGIFVPEKYRGNNVAKHLINKVIEIAQALDVSKLYLQTERLDGGLYPRLGWKPVEQVEYKGSDVLLMVNHIGA